MKLLALLGLDARLRRLRLAASEAALAAEDRAQLLGFALDDERQRVRLLLVLAVGVLGLTIVALALLSMAVVVNFWDTPQRAAAAWWVAGAWLLLWAAVLIWLLLESRRPVPGVQAARHELARDWRWLIMRFGDPSSPRAVRASAPRPETREELLARIERQRERVEELGLGTPPARRRKAAGPGDESMSDTAMRVAREHPLATAALAAGVVAALGPRRIVRWAAWVAPLLWRLR